MGKPIKIHNQWNNLMSWRFKGSGTKLAEYSRRVPMTGTIFKH